MSAGEARSDRRLLLVVGIGRSGTSLLSTLVRHLGFRVPQPEVRADGSNPRGFGEPRWAVDFHKALMRERRVTVFDSRPAAWDLTADAAEDDAAFRRLRSWLEVHFVGADELVIKDPRLGWFLPLWLRCAEDLGVQTSFATMLRHPAEVVRSARTWYGEWQNDGSRAAAWLNVTVHTERATRGAQRVFIHYPDLIVDWSEQIRRLGRAIDVPRLANLDPADHPAAAAEVDPSLRRSDATWDDVPIPELVRGLVDQGWERALRLCDDPDGEETHAALDETLAAYRAFYADVEALAQSSVVAVKPRGKASAPSARRNGSGPRRGLRRAIRTAVVSRVPVPAKQAALGASRKASRALGRAAARVGR